MQVKEIFQGEKAKVFQITQELDLKSGITGLVNEIEIVISMHRECQERDTVSVYRNLTQSWFGAPYQPVLLEILSNLIEL